MQIEHFTTTSFYLYCFS